MALFERTAGHVAWFSQPYSQTGIALWRFTVTRSVRVKESL